MKIWLIGMPGAGKTTVGKHLSQIMSADFFDLDAEFEVLFGISPEKCIINEGEDRFRELETEALKHVARKIIPENTTVLSTGGGIVTREKNKAFMNEDSVIIYIKRPLKDLTTDNRPFSGINNLEAVYNERYKAYEGWSDIQVKNIGNPEAVAAEICKLIEQMLKRNS